MWKEEAHFRVKAMVLPAKKNAFIGLYARYCQSIACKLGAYRNAFRLKNG